MTYDLSTFAGRLAAVAAGETLVTDTGENVNLETILKDIEYLRSGLPRWSLKPELTVTITREQLCTAMLKTLDIGLGKQEIIRRLTEELGLGEHEE